MATIGEIKVHVTACGCEELSHLIAMLEANIENLPMVVVKALKALADSAPGKVAVEPVRIDAGREFNMGDIVSELNRASIAHGGR